MSPISGNISWVSPSCIETWLANEARMINHEDGDGDGGRLKNTTTRGEGVVASQFNSGNHDDDDVNNDDKNQSEKVVQLESEIEKLKKDVENILKMNSSSISSNKNSNHNVSTTVSVHSNQSMLQMQKQVDDKIVLYL
jgi:hypothetical protein